MAATKSKPKPIKISYTASALPDPTSTNPATNEICAPTLPTAIHHYTFKAPAAGTLTLDLNNKLDWSGAVRDAGGSTLVDSDGSSPETPEQLFVSFKKAQTVSVDTCNFAGEQSINVTGTFSFK